MSAPLFTSTSSRSGESFEAIEPEPRRDDPGPRVRRRLRAPGWWDGVPMRAQLISIVMVLLVVALTVTGWGLQHVLRGYLVARVDSQLASATQVVINQGNYPNNQAPPPTDYVVQYTFDNGNPAVRSGPPLTVSQLPQLPKLTSTEATARSLKPFTVLSADGSTKWRVVAVAASLSPIGSDSPGLPGSVEISLPLTGVSGAVAQVRLIFSLFGLMVTGICAILGWLAIRRAFLPLTEVEDTAAAIAAGDLSRRIPDHPASTEVGRLTSSLNGMLTQIESAFRDREASEQRTRRFAADASHELRTPLASIRGFAELYRQGAVSEREDVARVMSRIEDESRRMGALVEDLLLLARLDEQRPARTDPVDLAVLAGDATHDARGLAPDRRVQLVGLAPGRGPEPAVVIGDDNRLRQVIANLVGNAARHTPAGTPIEVAVGTWNGKAVLEVRDHGPGLPQEHAVKVFERFYRVDASRARSQGGGSGLGLSIVSAVINAHGGRVGVAQTPGGGATFRIELPLTRISVSEDVADLNLDPPALSAIDEAGPPASAR